MNDSPENPRPLRLALLGAGAAARLLYRPLMGQSDLLQWTHVVDPNINNLKEFQQISGLTLFQGTAAEFLKSDKTSLLDAVVIALPHHLHEDAVVQSLDVGLHVFCEKPLGMTAASVQRMKEASVRNQRCLAVCQPRREYPAFQLLRDILRSGMAGKVISLDWSEGHVYSWPVATLSQISAENGGEEVYDIGAHALDLIGVLCGTLRLTDYSDDSQGGAGAEFDLRLTGDRCGDIRLALSRLRPLRNSLLVICERGTIEWKLGSAQELNVRLAGCSGPLAGVTLQSTETPWIGFTTAIADQLTRFAAWIHGAPCATATADDALIYAQVFDQCRQRQHRIARITVRDHARPCVVTGASGFIGGRLVEKLQAAGSPVIALARRAQSCIHLARAVTDIRLADIARPEQLEQAIPVHTDTVFHCAVSTGSQADTYSNIVDGTRNVLTVAQRKGVRQVIIFSSMMAIGDLPATGIVSETTPNGKMSLDYGMAKQRMEQVVRAFAEQYPELKVAILRPTCVYGPRGKSFVEIPLQQMLNHRFFVTDEGQGTANLVYVDNLVDAAIQLTHSIFRSGDLFYVNEEKWSMTWDQYFRALSDLVWPGKLQDYPSFSAVQLTQEIQRRLKHQQFPQVFRDCIRSHKAARNWVNQQFWFRLLQRMRAAGRRGPRSENPATLVRQKQHGGSVHSSVRQNQFPLQDESLFLNTSVVRFFASQAIVSSEKLQKTTGWAPAIDRAQGLQLSADWACSQLQYGDS